jgi:hypothetical protein
MADESKDPLADYISVDDALLYWVRDRITLAGFDRKMWTEEHDGVCTDFLLSKTINKLTIIIVRSGDDGVGLFSCVYVTVIICD